MKFSIPLSLFLPALLLPALAAAHNQPEEKQTPADTIKVHALDEVTVSAYRCAMPLKDAPNKVEVISARDLKSTPAQNLAEMIKKNSNADAVDMQGLTGGIDFRGFAPSGAGTNSYTRLLVDGVPMSTRNTSATSLQNIESIEILKGPFSALYGSGAMGGIINLVTPQSRGKIAGKGSVGWGSYHTLSVGAAIGGNITRKLDFDLGFDLYNQNKDYKTGGHNLLKMSPYEKLVMGDSSYSARYRNTRYDRKAGSLRIGYDLSEKWRINLQNDIYYTGHGRGNGMFWGMYEQTDKKVFRDAHRLDITGREGRHSLRFSPYYSFEKSTYDTDFGYMRTSSRSDYQTWGAVLQDAIRLGDQTLVVGVDNFSQKYVTRQWKESGDPEAPFQPDYRNMQTGVFVQANLSFFKERLTAVAGVRYDNILFQTYATPHLEVQPDRKSYNTVNPNLAVKYKITPQVSLRASIGTAYLAPDAFKMTGEYKTAWGYYKGNPNLKPERSLTYDFGVAFTSRDRSVTADVTLFGTHHKNMILDDYSHSQSDGYITYINANSADVRGLEYLISADFGRMFSKEWSLRIYGAMTHIFHGLVTLPDQMIPTKYISRNNINFGADFRIKGFSVRLSGRYTGEKFENNYLTYPNSQGIVVRPALKDDQTVTLPDFMVFDLYADYRFTKNLSLGFKLANLLDENYMERDGYYMPGRNYTVLLSFSF